MMRGCISRNNPPNHLKQWRNVWTVKIWIFISITDWFSSWMELAEKSINVSIYLYNSWLAADEGRVSHVLPHVWWKKKKSKKDHYRLVSVFILMFKEGIKISLFFRKNINGITEKWTNCWKLILKKIWWQKYIIYWTKFIVYQELLDRKRKKNMKRKVSIDRQTIRILFQ